MPPHSTSLNTLLRPSRTSHGTSAILTHTDTSRHPTPLDFSWVHALHPSPSTAQRKTSDPQPISLKQHMVPLGWELYTANMLIATSWSMRVLPMGGGLCCSRTWNSLRTSSATAGNVSILQTERDAGEQNADCALGRVAQLPPCHLAQGTGTPHKVLRGCCPSQSHRESLPLE